MAAERLRTLSELFNALDELPWECDEQPVLVQRGLDAFEVKKVYFQDGIVVLELA